MPKAPCPWQLTTRHSSTTVPGGRQNRCLACDCSLAMNASLSSGGPEHSPFEILPHTSPAASTSRSLYAQRQALLEVERCALDAFSATDAESLEETLGRSELLGGVVLLEASQPQEQAQGEEMVTSLAMTRRSQRTCASIWPPSRHSLIAASAKSMSRSHPRRSTCWRVLSRDGRYTERSFSCAS
jgi:hypothetical protein